jgi:hypothetical protein
VKALVRVQTARWVRENERPYEITLDVRKEIEGSLTKEERTLKLPDGDSQHLLAAAGARWDEARGGYAFAGPQMTFTFSRVLSDEGQPSTLVLMSYEKVEDVAGPLTFTASDGAVLIGAADVVGYEWRTHTIRFRPGVLARLRKARAGEIVRGVPFTVRLGEVVIYPGVFTSGVSSISQSLPVMLLDGEDSATIQLGYPKQENFRGEDPRADPRLQDALGKAGLLRK